MPFRPILVLVLLAPAMFLRAQAPVSTDPGKKATPAEIMPPMPELRPVKREKTVQPPPAPLSPGTKAPPPGPPLAEATAAINALTPAELDEVLAVLKERFVNPALLSEAELKRAAVQGLLGRLAPAAKLDVASPAPPAAGSFHAEAIEARAGYIRVGPVTAENIAALDQALDGFKEKAVPAVVLDLRATPSDLNPELAAEICRRFVPKGKALFSVARPGGQPEQIYTAKTEPRFQGIIAILQSADAAGSAEVIAGVLRSQAFAMIIGQRSRGEAAEFAEVKLAGGHLLRLAVAEARLPDGQSLLQGGLAPDLPVEMAPEALRDVLRRELAGGIAPQLVEPEHPRLNEAALVAGTNPEIESMRMAQRIGRDTPPPAPRDEMLLRALDLITSLATFKS